jgi:hypothetical protein
MYLILESDNFLFEDCYELLLLRDELPGYSVAFVDAEKNI